jgi:hypothetical protein
MPQGPNAPYTNLSQEQLLQRAFEESADRLRVDANVTAVLGTVECVISASSGDNIAITNQDGTNPLVVNADGSINTKENTIGTWANGVQTAVNGTAVQIQASNANRKRLLIQNVGTTNIRIGVSGVTATTGTRLTPGSVLILQTPNVETNAIFSIAETSIASIALTQETV